MKIKNNKIYYNLTEVAQIIGGNKRDFYYLMEQDEVWKEKHGIEIDVLPKPMLIGKRRYFDEDSLSEWEEINELLKDKSKQIAYFIHYKNKLDKYK